MLLASFFAIALAAITQALAQDIVLNEGHNTTAISGTWCSGSQQVVTGPGFANPANMTFSYPPVTGVSFAFDETDNWYETARYRYNSNGSNPLCITGVLLWTHGHFSLNPNGSITLTPIGDGYQQVETQCGAVSNFVESYNDTELLSQWQITSDETGAPKLRLFQANGEPYAPLAQTFSTANLLPKQLLRNVTPTITDQSLFAANTGSQRWTPVGVMSLVSGAFVLGSASLLL